MLKTILNLRIKTMGTIIAFLVVLVGVVVFTSSLFMVREASKISSTWERFNRGPALKYVYFNHIRGGLGYGGAVHNLKNYILRRDRLRLVKIQEKIREAFVYLTAYRSIGVNPREKEALDSIEQVISNYSSAAGLAEIMVRDGKSAGEIDNAIKVDDTKALRAMEVLKEEIESARRASGKAVTASVKSAAGFVMNAAVVAGILLLLLVIDSFWFTRTRLSKPLLTLAKTMKSLAAGDTSVAVPGLDQRNEIGEMAGSVQVFKENAIRREAAEKALRASEQRFRSLVEYAADAIFVHDLDRNFIDANQRACKSLGYTREELLSMNVSDIDLNVKSKSGPPRISELQTGEIREIESVHTRKDGTSFPVEIRSGIIEIDGETLVVSLARDMTAHKEAEAKTRQAMAEAEAASRAKSDFLSNMSHELRSPLNSVVGFSDLLIRDSSDKLTLNLAPKIRDSGIYLTNLIEDLLDFDRIESGKVVLSLDDIPINDLVKSVLDAAAPQISGSVPLTLDLSMSAGNLMCDPIRIRQVLTNLLDNAVKYSPNGGNVHIRTVAYPDEVWVSVEDNGLGMGPDEMQGIFERFNQLESGYQRRSGGLGIGLSLIRELLELHGGRIWVESEKGKGSIFTFALPRVSAAPAASALPPDKTRDPAPRDNENPWNDRAILLVDDLEHYHEYMRLLMATASPLHSAYNGMEAIDFARRERPDIILMDLRMPIMDGFDAIEVLKSDPSTRDIPILAVTAQVMEQDRERSIEIGADGFVTKPINVKLLQNEIRRALENRPLNSSPR